MDPKPRGLLRCLRAPRARHGLGGSWAWSAIPSDVVGRRSCKNSDATLCQLGGSRCVSHWRGFTVRGASLPIAHRGLCAGPLMRPSQPIVGPALREQGFLSNRDSARRLSAQSELYDRLGPCVVPILCPCRLRSMLKGRPTPAEVHLRAGMVEWWPFRPPGNMCLSSQARCSRPPDIAAFGVSLNSFARSSSFGQACLRHRSLQRPLEVVGIALFVIAIVAHWPSDSGVVLLSRASLCGQVIRGFVGDGGSHGALQVSLVELWGAPMPAARN